MNITKLEKLFEKTCAFSNGCDFNRTFSQSGDQESRFHTTAFNAFYFCIEAGSSDVDFNWTVNLLHADGGVKIFQLFYKAKGLFILVCEMNYQDHLSYPDLSFLFNPEKTCQFLNEKEQLIKSTLNL